jgi:hypothetical protein
MLTLVEGIAYLYPHKPELVRAHPAMRGVWKRCEYLTKPKGSFLAPLLVDDLVRDTIVEQTLEEIIDQNIGRPHGELPWYGLPVKESTIAGRFGDLGCKTFDSLYHRDILLSLALQAPEWRWIVVHPLSFQDQQSGMLRELFSLIYGDLNWGVLAQKRMVKTETVRMAARSEFLAHFEHHWIHDDGQVQSKTRPIYRSGKIVHIAI